MCGIAGKFLFDPDAPVDRDLLAAMTGVIAHRGPDEAGPRGRDSTASSRKIGPMDIGRGGGGVTSKRTQCAAANLE